MITAKIIAHSISHNIELITMELCYPRFIHSEVMTHRLFSRNASSSRAIPIEKMMLQVLNTPAMPIHWGKNQPGMSASEECNEEVKLYSDDHGMVTNYKREHAWIEAADKCIEFANAYYEAGYHKQIVNRLLEPFQWIKVIVTATEWDNFFKLRLHPDAQPEIQELARCMKRAMEESTPVELKPGEWHLPYVTKSSGRIEDDIKCSVARCARVSYNNHDNSSPDIEKDIALADRLLAAGHMSPFEHQATPMKWEYSDDECYLPNLEVGVTHTDRYGNLWSGNFRGFLQYRQLL